MTFNQCTFIGNAGSEPKLLTTGNGKSFTRFRLAVPGLHKDEKNDTLWLTVLIWQEALAKIAAEFIATGSLVLVSGRLAERIYSDPTGAEKKNLELIADKVELLAKGKSARVSEPVQTNEQQQATL
jgi:single-strand DNA-binding protein